MSASALSTYTNLLQSKKHTWFKRVTPSHHQKVLRANQIQYRLERLDDGRIQVQAINILDNFQNSLGPEFIEPTHSSVLKAVVAKKWILAETLAMATERLSAQRLSLFCAYILFYDILMDQFLEKKDHILKDWLFVEKHTRSRPHSTLNPTNFTHDFEEKDAIRASCSRWGIIQLYNKSGDMTKLDEDDINQMRCAVLHWFKTVPCHGDLPP